MLQLAHLILIQECLGELPAVVDFQQRRLNSFPKEVLGWLNKLEDVLEKAYLQKTSDISALRSRLLVALYDSDKSARGGTSRLKYREAVASAILQEAQQTVSQAVAPRVAQFQEAENIAMRIASVARAKGVIDQALELPSHQEALQFIQSVMSRDNDTAAAMVHLGGIIGAFDLLAVLDRAIPELTA